MVVDGMLYPPPIDVLVRLLQHFCKNTKQVNQIHTLLITNGLLQKPNSNSNSKFSNWTNPNTTILLYNNLFRAHLLISDPHKPILIFTHMLSHQIQPNNHTFPSLIKAAFAYPSLGKSLHAQVIKRGFSLDDFINSCIVKFYAQFGDLQNACQVFDEIPKPDIVSCNSLLDALCRNGDLGSAVEAFGRMPERDVVSWTCIINGFGRNRHFRDAIWWFEKMMWDSQVRPNEATLVSVLSACANLDGGGALCHGRVIHGYVVRNKILLTAFLGTALIDLYGKSGYLGSALRVFGGTTEKEVCTWNAMISSFASNGRERDALDMFDKMRGKGFQPNEVTFVAVLTACARARLVEMGLGWFKSMSCDFGVVPRMEHYGCVVDLLGRAGLLKKAMEFVRNMPMEPDTLVWGALLGACQLHGDVELGASVGRRLLTLQPRHSGQYVVLSNIYAEAGRWVPAAELREAMEKEGIRKIAGYSWLSSG